ncbi:MAG TPA: 2-polyprenylphenol 6-hydroxylase [Thermoanaerobacterales bacterium]|nr:2-polyprenylphenol 6-hydroxylase [Thermoanaerobacterales bacterium]
MPVYKRYRYLSRYKEIANILFKYGLGYIVDILGLKGLLSYRNILFNSKTQEPPATLARRIRGALEELGPTFIKFGQVLSTRSDIISSEIASELEKLQDNVPPFPFTEAKEQIERELGGSIYDFFYEIDEQPLAAASIGQVHRAVLKNGKEVVVKVQRPNIEEIIERDLEVLFNIARVFERRTEIGKVYSLEDIVEEFARAVRDEMDYSREGRNAEKLKHNFSDINFVYIPEVYWEFTTKRVLTMELIEGIKVSNISELKKAGHDTEYIARKLAEIFLKQVLIDGFFHGDPHPGNVFIMDTGQIALIDFGVVGRIDEKLKYKFIDLILNITRKDIDSITLNLLQIGIIKKKVNYDDLKRDINNLYNRYYEIPLADISIGKCLEEVMVLAHKYNVVFPSDLTLLTKATITLEGIIKKLSAEISLIEIAEPFTKELLKEKLSIKHIKKETLEKISKLNFFLNTLPIQVYSILDKIESGNIKIDLQHTNLDELGSKLDIISNRLSFSIIVAGIIIGSSLISFATKKPLLWGIPIAELGFTIAGIMGFWLLISIIRSGRF